MGTERGGASRGRRSMSLGSGDPRNYRDPQSDQNPKLIYELPLRINAQGRVSVDAGNGLKVEGGKLVVDVAYLRTQLGL